MPFNVHIAANEDPLIRAPQQAVRRPRSAAQEFRQGLGFGLVLTVVLLATYWIVSAHIASFPNTQSLISYWFSSR